MKYLLQYVTTDIAGVPVWINEGIYIIPEQVKDLAYACFDLGQKTEDIRLIKID